MNWFPLILIPVILVQAVFEFLLKYVFKDGRTNRHKTLRAILLCLTITVLVTSQLVGWIKDNERSKNAAKQTEKLNQIGSEVSDQRKETSGGFKSVGNSIEGLSSVLATNPSLLNPTKRLAILSAEEKKITDKRSELKQQSEIIAIEPVSLGSLRTERTNRKQCAKPRRS